MSNESALRYDRLVEGAGALGDSHRWLVDRVPPGSLVLDCGCAGGYLARELAERQCAVDGVDIESQALEAAASACRNVYLGSIQDEPFVNSLEGPYDRIVLGDVLEHTAHPDRAMTLLRERLAPGGRLLVSLPNIAYWRIRWDLLRGRFEYQDSGILDRTHLRFFTRDSAQAMARGTGFRIIEAEVTLQLPTWMSPVTPPLRGLMRRFPNFFGYQILLELEPTQP